MFTFSTVVNLELVIVILTNLYVYFFYSCEFGVGHCHFEQILLPSMDIVLVNDIKNKSAALCFDPIHHSYAVSVMVVCKIESFICLM